METQLQNFTLSSSVFVYRILNFYSDLKDFDFFEK